MKGHGGWTDAGNEVQVTNRMNRLLELSGRALSQQATCVERVPSWEKRFGVGITLAGDNGADFHDFFCTTSSRGNG